MENLADLTVEQARNELITKVIPNALSNETTMTNTGAMNETGNNGRIECNETIKDGLLQSCMDSPISLTIAMGWLCGSLGFFYEHRKKSHSNCKTY